MTGRPRELQDTIIERTAQKLEHVFGMAFHVVVAYFLSIARETDRPMNSKIQSAHLIYSNSHQHSLKHDLDIMI